MKDNSPIIIVRGAGDLATGTIARLFNSGLKVLALEIEQPTVIRTTVSFAQALFDGSVTIEGITARKASNLEEAATIMANNQIPILVDPEGESITLLKPIVVVDAILAKKNLGTTMDMAPFVVALGPGFEAQKDCHCVIETKRGHFLGSIIRQGTAAPNSGIPGIIGGYGSERVLRAPTEGLFEPLCPIGTLVKAGDTVAKVEKEEVKTSIDGVVRGMLNNGIYVTKGFKVADVDPRGIIEFKDTISDKARAVAGGVLEAIDGFLRGNKCL